jgi:hypothetical protein
MKPATVSRRAARALVLESVRNLPREEFGECAVCSLTHNHPGVTAVCPECGRELCLGEPVCACGGSVRGGEYNAADAVGAARATAGPHGEYRPPTWRYPHGE